MDSHLSKRFLILGITGYARSGKDTLAAVIEELIRENFKNIKVIKTYFALPIKRSAAALLADVLTSNDDNTMFLYENKIDSLIETLDTHKNSNMPLENIDIRKLYQELGSIVRKQNKDFYVISMIKRINKILNMKTKFDQVVDELFDIDVTPTYIILVPDTRFPNEVDYLRKEFADKYKLIRIVRPEIRKLALAGVEPYNHESEKYIEQLDADYEIINDASINELKNKTKQYIFKLIKLHGLDKRSSDG